MMIRSLGWLLVFVLLQWGTATTAFSQGFSHHPNWTFWWEKHRDPYLDLGSLRDEIPFRAAAGDSRATSEGEKGEIDLREVELALREALGATDDEDLVSNCLVALGRIDGQCPGRESALVPLLQTYLADPRAHVHESAVVALVHAERAECVTLMMALVEDAREGRRLVDAEVVPERMRAFAMYGLGVLARRSGDVEVRRAVVRTAAARLGDGAMVAEELAVAAVIATGLVGEGDFDLLFDLVIRADRSNKLGVHAITALAQLASPLSSSDPARRRVAELLIELLRGSSREIEDGSVECARSAALGLGALGGGGYAPIDKEIRSVLTHAAREDADLQTRGFALISLAQVGARYGGDPEHGPIVRGIVERLHHEAEQNHEYVQPWAVLAIGILGHALGESEIGGELRLESAGVLCAALTKEDRPVIVAAQATALGLLGATDAAPLLLAKIEESTDTEAQGHIAIGLGLMGARDAIPSLLELVCESRWRFRRYAEASIALTMLGSASVVPHLSEELRIAEVLSTRANNMLALGQVGGPRAIPPLLTMLRREEAHRIAHGFAAGGLGMAIDPETWYQKTGLFDLLNYRAVPVTLYDMKGTGLLNYL